MPPRMPVTAVGCSVRPSSSRRDGHQRHDHLHDRARPEAEQERRDRRVVGARADPRAEHRRAAREQPRRGQPPERGARPRERRDDRQPLGRVVDREPDHEERAERERAGGVGGADRHALAEVVQPDPGGDERRRRPARRAPPATTRRRSANRYATPAPMKTSAAPPNACEPSPASSSPSSVASTARNAEQPDGQRHQPAQPRGRHAPQPRQPEHPERDRDHAHVEAQQRHQPEEAERRRTASRPRPGSRARSSRRVDVTSATS